MFWLQVMADLMGILQDIVVVKACTQGNEATAVNAS